MGIVTLLRCYKREVEQSVESKPTQIESACEMAKTEEGKKIATLKEYKGESVLNVKRE